MQRVSSYVINMMFARKTRKLIVTLSTNILSFLTLLFILSMLSSAFLEHVIGRHFAIITVVSYYPSVDAQ